MARAFWNVVDRTEADDGQLISQKHPPAAFHLLLDGQQRLQSLLLAFGGTGWGIKMLDRKWHEDLNGVRPRGPRGQLHWSHGCVCVNVQALTESYATKKRATAIDYQPVLCWAITDATTGQSSLLKPENYNRPLEVAGNGGRFIRLSRLWSRPPNKQASIPTRQRNSRAGSLRSTALLLVPPSNRSAAGFLAHGSQRSQTEVFRKHYQSLNALAYRWAWCFGVLRWREDQSLKELAKDSFDKSLTEALNLLMDRWLICTQWAGVWATGSAQSIIGFAHRLAASQRLLGSETTVSGAIGVLKKTFQSELQTIEQAAVKGFEDINAEGRHGVRGYYTILWLWNRMDANRWESAKPALGRC